MENAADSSLLNALIRASDELTLPEKCLIVLALSKINSRCISNRVAQITSFEYAELEVERGKDTDYDQLRRASMNLYNRSIIASDGDVCMRWLDCCQYYQSDNRIELRWCTELLPLLVLLRQYLSSK